MRDDALDLLLVRWNFLSLLFNYIFSNLYRKCSSTIRYDVYRPNNVSIILISNNSIHKIYLYRRLSLYLLSKREPSDIKWLCVFVYARVLFVNCYVRYFLFLFLIDICSYTSLSLSLPYINQNRTHNCWLICSFFPLSPPSITHLPFLNTMCGLNYSFFFLFFFVTRTYDVKNNESVQRMIT
jgi:hypothetical protein